ncbi:MAG: trigger factor [Alphaproteobacteria bacterium]|nr:trigger factor [Alphaproteobacteria bacterium]OJV46322.1 MAG: trigger factor [Alphaproteobacteria bacterium 43-37]
MNITEVKNEGLTREFKVIIPNLDVEDLVTKRLADISPKVKIAGFRNGKVPQAELKRRYGKSTREEVLSDIVENSIQQVINDHKLTPVMQPQISQIKGKEGEDVEFILTIENTPHIEPKPMDKVSIERLKVTINEDEVDERLKVICERNFTAVPIKKERAAQAGDIVTIDFDGKLENGSKIDGGSDKGFELELGSGVFIPGFEEQLVGAKKGVVVTVKVPFPESYHEKKLAGKNAIFTVTLHEINEKIPSKADDEFAKKLGFETLGELRKVIYSDIKAGYSDLIRTHMKRQLLDALAGDYDFDVPQTMVEGEFHSIWHQLQHALENGTREEVLGEDAHKSEDDLKKEYRQIAVRRVRLGLLLAEIGRRQNVMVTPDELRRAIVAEAQRFPGQEQQVFEYYSKNKDILMQLRAPLFEEKVVDHIFSTIEVSEKTVTPQELMEKIDEL